MNHTIDQDPSRTRNLSPYLAFLWLSSRLKSGNHTRNVHARREQAAGIVHGDSTPRPSGFCPCGQTIACYAARERAPERCYEGKETGKTALLRSMLDRLNAEDVLLGDSYFCSYFMIALLPERGVDIVFRQHQRRRTDFCQGKRLGNKDHIVRWRKPARPAWMDEETDNRLPDEITVRGLTSRVSSPGFRPSEIVLVTTMTDCRHYTKDDVFQVFRGRWNAEIDFRRIRNP